MSIASSTRAPAVERIDAPFKGLTFFTENDSEIFFGRDEERVLIAATLLASRFTVVYGESGVGKSSLLRAGVVHDLRQRALRERAERSTDGSGRRGARFIPVVVSEWSKDPLNACDEAFRSAAQGLADTPLPELVEGAQFDALLESCCESTGAMLLVVLDQFEEYLLYHAAEGSRDVVGEGLARALARRDLRVRFLVSIREDALAKLDRYEARIPNLFENFIRVEHLDKAAGEAAIRGPIDRYNAGLGPEEREIRIEDELVERVLSQVERGEHRVSGNGSGPRGDARIETAFLQLVMERLWNEERKAESDVLRASTFDGLGGAKKIVLAHLGDAMDDLSEQGRAIAAKAFSRLVTPSRQKIAYLPSDLAAAEGVAPADMEEVLARLEKHRILRPVAPPPELEERRYELFHDVLADPVLTWRASYEEARAVRRAEEQQAARQKAFTKKLALSGAVVAVVALGLAALAAWALQQRGVASDQRATAQANGLAFRAGALLETAPVQSVKVAAEAVRLAQTGEAVDALRSGLAAAIGRRPIVLRGHKDAVGTARFSSDGTRVVTSSDDGTARIWSASTGRPLRTLGRPSGPPISAADFSPDGRRVVTAGSDGIARIWLVATGRRVDELRGHTGVVTDARFSPDGELIATSSDDGTARIWKVSTRRLVQTFRGHRGAVNAINFSPDGSSLITAGADGTARIWPTSSSESVKVLRLPAPATAAEFSPDGTEVVAAGGDGFTRIWDLASARLLSTFVDQGTQPFASFSADGMAIVTAGPHGTSRIRQTSNGTVVATLSVHGQYIRGASFSPDKTNVVTANTAPFARIWNVSGVLGESVPTTAASDSGSILCAAVSADTSRVAVGLDDGSVLVSRVADGALEAFHQGSIAVLGLAFSPDGKQIAVRSADGSIRVLKTMSGRTSFAVPAPAGPAPAPTSAPAFGPDGKRFVAATPSGAAIFRTDTSSRLLLHPHGGMVVAVAFSPDGKSVATGSADGTVTTFDAADGRELVSFPGGKGTISTLSFSPDGATVVIGQAGGVGRIVDLATRRHTELGGTMRSAAFNPSGDLVASGALGTTRISGRTGKTLTVLRGHAGPVLAVAFSADGSRVVTTGLDGTIRAYECGFCGGVDDLLRRADRY